MFASARDELEEQVRGVLIERNIPNFVALCRYRHSATRSAMSNSIPAARNCSSRSSRHERNEHRSPAPRTRRSASGVKHSPAPGSPPQSSTGSPSEATSSTPEQTPTGSNQPSKPDNQQHAQPELQPNRVGPKQNAKPGPNELAIPNGVSKENVRSHRRQRPHGRAVLLD